MPNGQRVSYRLESGLSPSPAHTSDSETTEEEKKQWRAASAEEKKEWRATQMYTKTIANRLFPMILMHQVDVLLDIAKLL